ncbi:hypothetical protein [Rickettsia endosymbiont of Nabis limbatus]|uniref:hypothetical protein n=1 Tax=Rickettsia endosymbiont of Nabis limbatus TaxID=3066268 RepID=UPI003AF39DCE
MITTISPISSSDNTYAYYKQKIDDIGNKTVEIHVMISSLRNNTLFLRKENINLKSELQKVMQQRDDLNKKIVHLEADKQILEYEIGKLTTNLTKVQDSEKALQVKLDNTTNELNAANHSLNIMLDVLEKIQKRITIISDIPSASKYFMEKKANYTDYVNNYANDQNALNVFITNINNNIKKSKDKIDVLESKLNNKNIELNETRKALNKVHLHKRT